ncbi:MAG: molecular chaperone SurA [Gammaproteobacteria bacterium]|jgi:peptidyl-prolyl cis-trans isomerase SurA|nr:molecular chaperone SurA [Gammaproteobacteria bacterium]MBT3858644.1 molecular chaperone SurA [Gammaproteobacteria bacterium]MBT3987779.1 molecular chaperone SurA [Gammaproteobacteria bacterium]MBT4583261.1 molecular chaperone SurA [Gammaproteobacteria bacterium]MBT4657435.1 molecular chaperone SurA [Gammaproteobacteria bacterium]
MNRKTLKNGMRQTASKLSLSKAATLLCLLSVTLFGQLTFAQRQLLDRIIVIVDDGVVLQSELNLRLLDIRQQSARSGQPLPPTEQLEEEVLDALILENIQLEFAERASIRFDDDTVNRVLNSMAEQNNMSFEEYLAVLEEAGVYLQTRDQVRRQMTLQELQRGLVNSRITINEQEIDNFLNSEMGREVMAADYLIDHMLIPISNEDAAETNSAKLRYAADLYARVSDGEPLGAVRQRAARGGDFPIDATEFGYLKADQLPALFSELVEEMAVGDVVGPIEAGNGYHIIQLADRQGGTEQIINQTNIRHIMLTPNEIRDEDQTLAFAGELRQRIIDGEDFADLARQNSDDASSVVAGGDLDWVNEGGMPIEMETIIDALELGEISEPYRTGTGWHIAEVLGRKETDLSLQYSRNQAENALRNRKFDLELQNWLIEIREKAFIEFVD